MTWMLHQQISENPYILQNIVYTTKDKQLILKYE